MEDIKILRDIIVKKLSILMACNYESSLAGIARQTGLSRSETHGLLKVLARRGFVHVAHTGKRTHYTRDEDQLDRLLRLMRRWEASRGARR